MEYGRTISPQEDEWRKREDVLYRGLMIAAGAELNVGIIPTARGGFMAVENHSSGHRIAI